MNLVNWPSCWSCRTSCCLLWCWCWCLLWCWCWCLLWCWCWCLLCCWCWCLLGCCRCWCLLGCCRCWCLLRCWCKSRRHHSRRHHSRHGRPLLRKHHCHSRHGLLLLLLLLLRLLLRRFWDECQTPKIPKLIKYNPSISDPKPLMSLNLQVVSDSGV